MYSTLHYPILANALGSRYPLSGGAFKVQIYTPYVVFNKTGLDFALKSKAPFSSPKNVAGLEIFSKDHRRAEATPFLFNYGSRDARNRALLRLADSAWSEVSSPQTYHLAFVLIVFLAFEFRDYRHRYRGSHIVEVRCRGDPRRYER